MRGLVVGALLGLAARAEAQPAVVLDRCTTLDRTALRAAIDRELAAAPSDRRNDELTVVVRCPDPVTAYVAVERRGSATPIARSLDLGEVPRDLRIKLLAVAAAELVATASLPRRADWSGPSRDSNTSRSGARAPEPASTPGDPDAPRTDAGPNRAGHPASHSTRPGAPNHGLTRSGEVGPAGPWAPSTSSARTGEPSVDAADGQAGPRTDPRSATAGNSTHATESRSDAATRLGGRPAEPRESTTRTSNDRASGEQAPGGLDRHAGEPRTTTGGRDPSRAGPNPELGGRGGRGPDPTGPRGEHASNPRVATAGAGVESDRGGTAESTGGVPRRVASSEPAGDLDEQVERARPSAFALLPRFGVRIFPRRPIPLAHLAIEAELPWLVLGVAGAAGTTTDTLGTLTPYLATVTASTPPRCAGRADRACVRLRGEVGVAGVMAHAVSSAITARDARTTYVQLGVAFDAVHMFGSVAGVLGLDAGWAGGLVATAPDRAPVRLDGVSVTTTVGLRWTP